MHKRDIIKQISDELGYSENQVYKIVQAFIKAVINTVITEGRLEMRGFGVFEVRKRKPKKVRDISTGKLIKTKPYKDFEFKTSSVIKKLLNNKKR